MVPGLTLTLQWDASSARWIQGLPGRIEAGLKSPGFRGHAYLALNQYARAARAAAPRSPTEAPHVADDWQILSAAVNPIFYLGGDRPFFFASVGSTRSQPAYESSDPASAPFNVPAGLHHGFESHRVWLYLPSGVKQGPRVRRKLAQFIGAPADSVDDLKAWLRAQGRPPWINVSWHRHVPRYYIYGPHYSFLKILAADLAYGVWKYALSDAWRAA